uniref:Pleckstrin homology and RhoGEF domain containing G4B n=1 Tax=Cyprinus carpio carpio TaxID=630221 RepID=A0A8C1C3S5_CYPCA
MFVVKGEIDCVKCDLLQDSESLDRCIQSVLSALYPPFSASAATVLWQLFSVVERQYRGDGLRCFIDFLLPSKRILQTITQEACLRFKGLLLYHEGWPLCLHEKVVLQLAPLHKVRLRQGDFYLQVVPLGHKAAKLVIKCLSGSGQAITEIPVAESMYGSVFTPDFLQNVMRERKLHPLQNCLLSTGAVVYRTPWKNVVNPLFVTCTADAIMQARSGSGTLRGQLSTCSTHGSTGTLSSRDSLGAESTVSEPVLSRSLTDMGISSLHSEYSPLHTSPNSLPQTPTLGSPDQGCIRGGIGHKILSFSTDLSNPGLRKRHPRDSAAFESRRLFRKSYMEALQNPMNLGSSSESILEEGTESESEPRMRRGSGPKESIPRRISVRGWLGGDESCNDPTTVHPSKSVSDDGLHSSSRRNSNSRDEFVPHKPCSRSAVSAAPPPAVCPLSITQLNHELLTSGALTLPGNQDRGGRAVLQVCSRNQVWTDAAFTTNQISELLCYYCGRLRREKLCLGLTVLIDARRQPVASALFTALSELQTLVPNALNSVLILVDRDAAVKVDRDVSVPCEVLTSLKALQKHIDSSQLTREFEGSFPYEHRHYIHFRQKIEAFAASCSAAIASLQSSIQTLNNIGSQETSEEVSEVISQQKSLMKSVLDDTKLNRLRLEGGTFLARIRKEEMCENENYRDAVDLVGALYDQLDEEVHKLVILSNKSLQQLEKLLELRVSQERHQEVRDAITSSIGILKLPTWEIRHCDYAIKSLRGLCFSISPAETQNGLHSSEVPALNSSSPPCFEDEDEKRHSAGPFSRSQFPFEDTDSDCTVDSSASCHSEPLHSPATRLRKQPLKKIMKKTLSYELPARDRAPHGYSGVCIRGLEVSNITKNPALGRSRSMSSPDTKRHSGMTECFIRAAVLRFSKIQHIMDEMISTEREYVRSLGYIIQHYFPEMERLDLPQDLRGKRSCIFGNLEKLCDFHSQYFLTDLESCAHSPLSISSCFLKHEEQFGMYALYSKNKPRSDALLTSHGNSFFKNKQVELGDKMDLASYLLKPIQRMSKYALLLKDLIKECGQSQEQELADLRTAQEMVRFQLRHGNDLLAMDAIRGCDVNLKEQGQLRCQDEFIVWCGRKKYLRHVFLFEDLILFSKTKKIEGGFDIYIYKQSFKTAEIGMTESVGDSGLRFEIWFRRRKSQDTFILQAASGEVKNVWTAVIGKILWRQALRNRELRMQEMVSMGIGNKPFMDIKPSDSAISDRAVDYMKGSGKTLTSSSSSSASYCFSGSL